MEEAEEILATRQKNGPIWVGKIAEFPNWKAKRFRGRGGTEKGRGFLAAYQR
jgi:hypothetical protein